MVRWPTTGSLYPRSPKAYPATPLAYPGSNAAVYPIAVTDNFSQSSGVDVVAEALGVADFSQSSTVEASATLSALTPAQLRVQVANAAITLGSTMRLTGTSPAVTLTGTLLFGAGLAPGIKVEITTGGAVGVGVFRVSYNSGSTWAYSGVTIASTYALDGAASGVTLNFAAGTYVLNDTYEGTVGTIRSTEGSSYTFSQATASAQPVLRDSAVTPDGKDAMFFAGAQYVSSTDAAILALFTNDPANTIMCRVAYTAADAAGRWFSVAQIAGTNGKRHYGQVITGNGREAMAWINDGNVANGTHTCSTDPLTGGTAAHNVCYYGPGSGGSLSIDVNGSNETISPNTVSFGTLTPTRAAIGAVADNSADTFLSGHVYDLAAFNSSLGSSDRGLWNTALLNGTT